MIEQSEEMFRIKGNNNTKQQDKVGLLVQRSHADTLALPRSRCIPP